jgi:hypothetical protein
VLGVAVFLLPCGEAKAGGNAVVRHAQPDSRAAEVAQDSARRQQMAAVLSPTAKAKLRQAKRGASADLARIAVAAAPNAKGERVLAATRARVRQQFPRLTAAQENLLTYYVVSELANEVGANSTSDDMQMMALQNAISARGQALQLLSNMLAAFAEQARSIVGNLR